MSEFHVDNAYAQKLLESSRTPEEFKTSPKTYYHQHKGAMFHFDLGRLLGPNGLPAGSVIKSVAFAGGVYTTDDKREQDQLDMVADVSGSMIYRIRNSDVQQALQQELAKEAAAALLKSANAADVAAGRAISGAPIQPVLQHPNTPDGMTALPIMGAGGAVVGTQNSMNAGAVMPMGAQTLPTTPASQSVVKSATEIAMEAIRELEKEAQK